jgi:hypothetical protein
VTTPCGRRIDGTIRALTLHDEFVIFDFKKWIGCGQSLDIAPTNIAASEEDPPGS